MRTCFSFLLLFLVELGAKEWILQTELKMFL